MTDRITASRLVHRGWFNVRTVTLEIGGETVEREINEHPDGVAVFAYDPERRVATLVSETRPPVLYAGAATLLEVIAGKLEGDDPPAGARREAMEEAGLRLGALEPVGVVWPTPATSTERVHLFLAAYGAADRVGEGGGLAEEQEHLHVEEIGLDQLWRTAEQGGLGDAKVLLLLQTLRIRRPELFEPA